MTLKPRHTLGAFFSVLSNETPPRGVALQAGGLAQGSGGRILLLAVFLGVSLSRFFGVISGMDGMTACGVSMMCRFLVMPTVVMLRCFLVVSGSVGVML
jgi:hypothetical protein